MLADIRGRNCRVGRSKSARIMTQPNSVSSGDNQALASHPKTTVVIVLTWGLIVLTVILMTDLPHRAYAPLKWILSLGLIYCSGYYLLPRRKAFIQHPDNAGESGHLKNPLGAVSEDDTRRAGWIEIDRLDGTAVEWTGNTAAPIDDWRIQKTSDNRDNFRPISQSVAAIHVLAAILLCPMVGINMSKINWNAADVLLICYLACTLAKVGKERRESRYTILRLDLKGEPRETDSNLRENFKGTGIRSWAMLVMLAWVIAVISLNDSGVFYRSFFSIVSLVWATAIAVVGSFLVIAILFGLLESMWKCSPPIELLLATGFVIFLLLINSQLFM